VFWHSHFAVDVPTGGGAMRRGEERVEERAAQDDERKPHARHLLCSKPTSWWERKKNASECTHQLVEILN
jgi:hypothetical protein